MESLLLAISSDVHGSRAETTMESESPEFYLLDCEAFSENWEGLMISKVSTYWAT